MKYIVVKRKYNLQTPHFIARICGGVLPRAIYKVAVEGGIAITRVPGVYEPDGIYLLQMASGYIVLFPESAGGALCVAELVNELQKPELNLALKGGK